MITNSGGAKPQARTPPDGVAPSDEAYVARTSVLAPPGPRAV